MTPVSIRILALAAVASLPLLAQQPSPSPQPPAGGSPQTTAPQQPSPQPSQEPGATQNPPATPVPSTANAPETTNSQLRPVTGELENKLDSKDAKTGDSVVVKTTQPATIGTGVEIPTGSEIKGHIVDVAPKGQGGENARVTIQFDQAQLKNGQSLPIRSVIQSIAPPGAATDAASAGGPPATTPGVGVPGSQPSSSDPSQPAAGAAQSGPPVPGTVVATKGNLAIKTTSIPGVLLIGDVNGRPFSNASGALLGAKQDVHLDNGTVVVVAIMTAPPTVGAK